MRVVVDDAEDRARVLALQRDPVLHRAEVVPDVQLPDGWMPLIDRAIRAR
jgi:hypothetical protein